MYHLFQPDKFVVAEAFRWRGLMYEKGSGLPPGIPQGAISSFLHKDPPLIKLKTSASSNGAGKKTTKKKTTKKRASKKKSKVR